MFEAVDWDEVLRAQSLGVDGVVLKGSESGGRVGQTTAFILLQRWHARFALAADRLPAWVQGGIGLNSAAACLAAGADGVVLDAQVLLTRESPLAEPARAGWPGSMAAKRPPWAPVWGPHIGFAAAPAGPS